MIERIEALEDENSLLKNQLKQYELESGKKTMYSQIEELNLDGRAFTKEIFENEEERPNDCFFNSIHEDSSKGSYLFNVYGLGGIERLKLLKSMFVNLIQNILPNDFMGSMTVAYGFKDPGEETYQWYFEMPKSERESLLHDGLSECCSSCNTYIDIGLNYD